MMNEHSSVDSGGVRAQIRFSEFLNEYVLKTIKGFALQEQYVSPTHLLYLYSSAKDEKWNFFALFQVARFRGRLTVELGISKRKSYPYFPAFMEPFMGVDGVRERLGYLMFKEDRWWEFRTQMDLKVVMNEIFNVLFNRGMYVLTNASEYKLDNEMERADKLGQDWRKIEEQHRDKPLGKKFDLKNEARAWETIKTCLEGNRLDRWIGGALKQEYLENEQKRSCLLYTASRILEQDNLDHLLSARPQYFPYEQDHAVVIHRRAPELDFFVKNEDLESRREYYSLLKALEITEALFYREENQKGEPK